MAGFRHYKSGQEGLQMGQLKGFQIGARRLKLETGISNRVKRDYKPGQEFQIAAGITNRCRTGSTTQLFLNVYANRIQFFLVGNKLNEKNC